MKKILATLLVATMLLSCLTFVGFAADVEVYTLSAFDFADLSYTPAGRVNVFNDPFASAYYDYVSTKIAYPYSASAFMASLDTALYGGSHTVETLTKDEYVIVPIYVKGASSLTVYVTYDEDVFTPDISNQIKFNVNASGSVGIVDNSVVFNLATGSLGDQTGFFGAVPFQVKSDAVGDKDGNATATFSLTFANDGKVANKAETLGSLGLATTMSVSLTGLEKGAEEDKEDTVIAQEDVNAMTAAATERVTIAENSNLEDILGDKVQSLNGDTDISKATAYKAVFATINLTDKITEGVEFGFVLRDKNGVGADRFFKATAQYGGKYGVAFFGTPEVLGWYEAIPAVKVNGQLLLNTSEKEAL